MPMMSLPQFLSVRLVLGLAFSVGTVQSGRALATGDTGGQPPNPMNPSGQPSPHFPDVNRDRAFLTYSLLTQGAFPSHEFDYNPHRRAIGREFERGDVIAEGTRSDCFRCKRTPDPVPPTRVGSKSSEVSSRVGSKGLLQTPREEGDGEGGLGGSQATP